MTNVVTPACVLSYPNLFTAKSILGGPVKYSAAFIFDPESMKTPAWAAMKAAETAVIATRLGVAKSQDKAFRRTLRTPFRDAGERESQGYEEGKVFINCSSDDRPKVVDLNGQDILDPSLVWAGQIVRASLGCFYYDKAGNRGVSFGLQHVQVLRPNMPRLDGRITADKAFGGVPVEGALVDADDEVI